MRPFQFHGRWYAADAHVRAVVLVSPPPLVGLILCLLNGFDALLGRPVKPSCPVVARDISALPGVPGLDVRGGDTVLLNPYSELLADVFRAVACWE